MTIRQDTSLNLGEWPMLRRDAASSGSDGSSIHPPLEKVWEFQARDQIKFSLAVAHGTIFFGSKDKNVYAVDASTGQGRWTFKMKKDVVTTPIVADGIVYVASKDKHLYALDAKTGETRWQHSIGSDISSTPAAGHGMVFFGSGDKHIYALDAQTGQQRWKYNIDGKYNHSPVIADGIVFTPGNSRNLLAINAINGQLVWEHKANTIFSPIVIGKYSFIQRVTGQVDVIEINEGAHILKLFEHNVREISANRNFLFVSLYGLKGLLCFDVNKIWKGDPSWDLAFRVIRGNISMPAVGNDFAFMSDLGGKMLFGINISKFMMRVVLQLDDKLKSPPVISNDMLFLVCDKGKVLAFKGTSDPLARKTLEPQSEGLYVSPELTYTAILYQTSILWPGRCCLCCGPAEEKERIFRLEGSTRLELDGVPYCKPCKQKVRKLFRGREKLGVDIIKIDPPILAFRNERYWVMFMEANKLR